MTVTRIQVASAAIALLTATPLRAQPAEALGDAPPRGFSGTVRAAVFSLPRFEGSRTSDAALQLDVQLRYRTSGLGTFSAGTRGVAWRADGDNWSAGLAASRHGRRDDVSRDERGDRVRVGGERLPEMGDIDDGTAYTLHGGLRVGGLPLHARAMKISGTRGGVLLNLGADLEWRPSGRLRLSATPSATWADGEYMQSHFGVPSARPAAGMRGPFEAGAGFKSVQVGVGLAHPLSTGWTLGGGVMLKRLVGDAARSPLTERKTQALAHLALTHDF